MALVTCPDCGKQVSSRAVSCPGCGFPIAEEFGNAAPSAAPVSAAPAVNPQLAKTDREILLLYLQDLRSLELVRYNYVSIRNKFAERYHLPQPRSFSDLLMSLIDRVFAVAKAAIPLKYEKTPLQIQTELRGRGLSFPDFYIEDDNGKKVSAFRYICETQNVPKDVGDRLRAAVLQINPRLETVDTDIIKARVALKKAYEPNIIPLQFRDLYPIYYLCDYMSTSQESLSDALLHLDLDLIKQKLDVVIAQQCVGLIQQAVTNAKLGHIESQMDTLIETAKSINANTADIARYTQMSAAHLETIKYLQFVNL